MAPYTRYLLTLPLIIFASFAIGAYLRVPALIQAYLIEKQ